MDGRCSLRQRMGHAAHRSRRGDSRRQPLAGSRTLARTAAAGLVAWLALLGPAATGCGSGGKNTADGPHDYVIPDVTLGEIPEECAHGKANEKGVGAPCSSGGKECKSGLICACEPLLGYMLAGAPCICTIGIFGQTCDQIPSDYCGSNAMCCSWPDIGSACIPSACLEMSMCPKPSDLPDAGDTPDGEQSPVDAAQD